MSKPLFVLSKYCTSRTRCSTCRDPHGGQAWRRTMATTFTPPPQWECPHGLAWQDPPATDEPCEPCARKRRPCSNCDSPEHSAAECPIPSDYDPADYASDSRGTPGGCCDPPAV